MATTNQYKTLDNDNLGEYGDYTNPQKLDCAATHYFVGKQTRILKRKKFKNGFDVMVANGDKITQQQCQLILLLLMTLLLWLLLQYGPIDQFLSLFPS